MHGLSEALGTSSDGMLPASVANRQFIVVLHQVTMSAQPNEAFCSFSVGLLGDRYVRADFLLWLELWWSVP